MLFYDDFEAAQDPLTGEAGEVRWEGSELRMLVSQAGRTATAGFKGASATDYRLHVTARPVRLHPGSRYGVMVRMDPDRVARGGYWFSVRGDGTCQACIEGSDRTRTCPVEGRTCPAEPTGENQMVIEVLGSTLSFWLNGTLVATFEDESHPSGAVALYVGNDEETADTLVAFDDLTLFEP